LFLAVSYPKLSIADSGLVILPTNVAAETALAAYHIIGQASTLV